MKSSRLVVSLSVVRGRWTVGEQSVDASQAREYLCYLAEMGIGRRSIHKRCGVSERAIGYIVTGKKSKILRSIEARILAIQPFEVMPRGALVDSEVTRRQIDELLAVGFTKSDIAGRLKMYADRLRIFEGDKVRLSTALKVDKVYHLLMLSAEQDEIFADVA